MAGSRQPLASSADHMCHIFELTAPFVSEELDIVHIRFPNTEARPLSGCAAGTIIYVFTQGEVTVCPYLVFAAQTPGCEHDPTEFIVGNILTDTDIAARLDSYRFSNLGRHQPTDLQNSARDVLASSYSAWAPVRGPNRAQSSTC